ncbi:ferritin family protein [bacterium]|nr:ferritin family protein [bacterium]
MADQIYNIDEVFEMAEQMERNGARFYRTAAKNFEANIATEMLLELAAMEDDHERVFIRMRERIAAKEFGDGMYDPQGEAGQYMQAMMHGKVFGVEGDPSRQLKGEEPLADILRTAILLEKDTIAFYSGIKILMPEDLGQKKVDSIIREEMSHVTLLNRRLEQTLKDTSPGMPNVW